MSFDKPNVVIPLAASYNERNVHGYNAMTGGFDQRKINSMYEPITNSLTGETTLYLKKRPGVSIIGSTFGDADQVAYFVTLSAGFTGVGTANHWVLSVSTSTHRVSDNSNTTTYVTTSSTAYHPAYVDHFSINAVDHVVIQLRPGASLRQRVFYASSFSGITEITDTDFNTTTHDMVGKMEFMDGYAFYLTDTGRIYNSDINTISTWDAANFITKQMEADLSRGLMRLGNQILAFGTRTVEVFYNAGLSGAPLLPIKQLSQRIGIQTPLIAGQTQYYAKSGRRLYFVGIEGDEFTRSAMSYDGSRFEYIGTPAIDKIFSSKNVFSVNSIGVGGTPAIAFSLDLTTATTQRWMVFFPQYKEWFEWESNVFTPVNSGVFHLGVGSNQNRLYDFTATDNWLDESTQYTMTHQFLLPSGGHHFKKMPICGVIGDTTASTSTSNLGVEFSDDDFQSFTAVQNIDMTQARKVLTRQGSWRGERAVRLTNTANLDCRLRMFFAQIVEK